MNYRRIVIEEWVEAEIWEGEELKETRFFKGNTVTATGKTEIAELVAGLDTNTIDVLWAKINDTMTAESSSNSRVLNTLNVTTGSAYTIPGTYSAVFTGNVGLGSGSYYNSIAVDIELVGGSSLDFTVKWLFTGAESLVDGNKICASRLGKIGDDYDYPISSIAVSSIQGSWYEDTPSTNNVSNNTLTITHNTLFSGPKTITYIYILTSGASPNEQFDELGGFTMDIAIGSTLDITTDFVFG